MFGDKEALADKINIILNDDELREKMSQKSLDKIQWYTFENMKKRHIKVFEEVKR